MPDALDLSLLATTATDYARAEKAPIFSKLIGSGLSGLPNTPIKPIDEFMMMIPGNDEVVLTELYLESVVQSGAKGTFNPTNDAVRIKPKKAKVKPCKVDLLFTEQKILSLYKSWYGQVRGGKIDKTSYPFEEWVIEHVLKRVSTDLRQKALINGTRNDAGTTPEQAMDGLFVKLAAAKTAGTITAAQIATIAAITAANAVTEFEKIVDKIPTEYFYSDLICLCPLAYKKAYERHYRATYGTTPYNAGYNKQEIEGTMIEFLVEPGMATTGLTGFESPIITTRENFAWLYDDESAQTRLEFDYSKRDRSLAYVMDFQVGFDWALDSLFWLGDVP
ncbi:hypothetical protein P1X15_07240 [Runella sp. MFBS21]|uniref:hypothetical protein n=1 Tax=Runella sp. MFBS21 TaxID=3034018 RepID=UPI0023F68C7E|nr:hypothetical protein [Runella sp. MFBS21]MDF7817381.1 hypothetical protein [Runella sp. MFBS21]